MTLFTYNTASIDLWFGPVRVVDGAPTMDWCGGTHTYTATCTIPRRRWKRLRRAIYGVPGAPLRLGSWWVRRFSPSGDTRSA